MREGSAGRGDSPATLKKRGYATRRGILVARRRLRMKGPDLSLAAEGIRVLDRYRNKKTLTTDKISKPLMDQL